MHGKCTSPFSHWMAGLSYWHQAKPQMDQNEDQSHKFTMKTLPPAKKLDLLKWHPSDASQDLARGMTWRGGAGRGHVTVLPFSGDECVIILSVSSVLLFSTSSRGLVWHTTSEPCWASCNTWFTLSSCHCFNGVECEGLVRHLLTQVRISLVLCSRTSN